MTKRILTQERLKEALNYNQNTGVFTWLVSRANCVKIGDEAGCLNKSNGYRVIWIDGALYRAHRLAWFYITNAWPEDQVDHINHIRDDNRFINLREATDQENRRNMAISIKNTSGVSGVNWKKSRNKWIARITINYKEKSLGYFDDKFEAICARLSANIKHGFHENHGAINENLALNK